MMRGISGALRTHHKVRILDEAIVASVQLSSRYIPGRQLPDKSVSLLDTACARVALSQTATPAAIEDSRRRVMQLESNITILERENSATDAYTETLAELKGKKATTEASLTLQLEQWEREKELIETIRGLRTTIEEDFLVVDGGRKAARRTSQYTESRAWQH